MAPLFPAPASALTSLLCDITFTPMPVCVSPLMRRWPRRRDEDITAQEVPGLQRSQTPAVHRCCKRFYHVAAMPCSLFLIPLLIWGNRSESINAFPPLFFSIRLRCFFVPQVVTHWGNASCFFSLPVMWNPLALILPSCRATMQRFKGAYCPALVPSWRFGSCRLRVVLCFCMETAAEKKKHRWKDEWPFNWTELKVE